MYLRFVHGTESQDGRWLTGIITASGELLDDGLLDPYQVDIVDATYKWLNEHLPCPPFSRNLESGIWSANAVAWFLPEARKFIERMWDLVAVLEDHGRPVRILRSAKPGKIVYRDD